MKAIINFGGFGGKLEVQGGEAVISNDASDSSFSVHFEELSHPQIDKAAILPGSILRIELEQNGQVIVINEGVYHKGKLDVRKFDRPRPGETLREEYLTKKGQWKPEPKSYGPPPKDALLIPIPFSEEI